MTYTIAYVEGMLVACVPDGDEAALDAGIAEARLEDETALHIESGLTLTNEWPDDEKTLAFVAGDQFLGLAGTNVVYRHAVRQRNAPGER